MWHSRSGSTPTSSWASANPTGSPLRPSEDVNMSINVGSTDSPPVKTKIAVLGAGMSTIAAMYELTQLPENRAKYDITVYTLGWRVGGKGASARNQQMGGRIEEHG